MNGAVLQPWVQCQVTLDGNVDTERLRAGLEACVRRHEALRTTFLPVPGDDAPLQIIGTEEARLPLRVVDANVEELAQLRIEERRRLDARNGPPLRALLVLMGDGHAALVVTAHALNADRESLRVVVRESMVAYPGGVVEQADPLLQYADFAEWHHVLLTGDHTLAERTWWRHRLAAVGPSPVGDLVPDLGGRSGPRQRYLHKLDPELAAGVISVADATGVPVGTVLETSLRLVLSRLTGVDNVLLASMCPGRTHAETAGSVGAFAREVPVAVALDSDGLFVSAVDRVQVALAEAAQRIDYLEPSWRRRGAGDGRVLTAPSFDYVELPAPVTTGCLTAAVVAEDRYSTAALDIAAVRGPDTITLVFDHAESALDAADVRRLAGRMTGVLKAVVSDRNITVRDALALSDAERAEGLKLGRPRRTQPVRRDAFCDQFAEQASAGPDRVAVVCGQRKLSYRELDLHSARLAHRLLGLGVSWGDRVTVAMSRSVDLLVALLGVAKAGAVFVPVDAGQPDKRLRFVLADTGSTVLLTDVRRYRDWEQPALRVVYPDGDESACSPVGSVERSHTEIGADAEAYVMYTSGSTGSPNGVVVRHGALANYLGWCVQAYELEQGTGALVHSSIGFDLTLTGLLGPLLVGQRVILLPDGAGIVGLAAALRSARDLSLVKLTPTHLNVLGQLLTPDQVREAVRTLVVGGEQLHYESLALFAGSRTRIVNEYGPTETVVGATWHVVDPAAAPSGPVPIGTPIANTEIYLLDADGQLVERGAVGEIYIGGDGVAAGYLNRADFTRRRFVASPLQPGRTLYRTGDLGRWLASGNLQFLGRIDDQVKIRGIRIEPAEIEHVLRGHPDVNQAVVVVRNDRAPGLSSPLALDHRLVGYVTPSHPDSRLDVEMLAAHCREQLPETLVPAALVVLAEFVTTANGKVDRAALPAPEDHRRGMTAFVAPRTATEEIVCSAIGTVLGLDQVGIDDNYFALGGDSIRSVMIVSRVQARGVELTVTDLHRYSTVRLLAAHADAKRQPRPEPLTEPFSLIKDTDRGALPADVEDAFPLSLLQEGMIFHRDFAAKSAVYHALSSVRLKAPLDLETMRLVIHQLVGRHPMLRTSFDMSSYSQPLQLVHTDYETPLASEDLRGLPPDEQDRRIKEWLEAEKALGFELHQFPLIRFMVHVLTDEVWQFTYGFHHEIVDGWSEALMITELFSHYFSLSYDEPVMIKAPSSTMRDAVALELEALEDQDNYKFWEGYLADAALMRLPRTGAGAKADKGDRAIVRVVVPVDEQLSDRLKALAMDSAVPLKNVLMAGHMAVMSAYGGHTDTLSYTVTNGRPETEDGSTAVGLFVNSLAIRLTMTGGTWRDLIASALQAEHTTMPYRRLPMAELKRHQGNEPLSECLFFFTNYHVYSVLDRWTRRGVEHVATDLYGESTFPFCAIFRLDRETGHLEVRLEYDSLQLTADLVDSIRCSYISALHAIVANPQARYEQHDLLSEADRRQLARCSSGRPSTPPTRCLHELVEQRAAQRPDAVALQGDDTTVSYRALNRRANRLAHHLRAHIGTEDVVGVLAQRGVEQIVCLLAVLKAGGAYLPLDPRQPDERIDVMVNASRATHVLVQQDLAKRVPAGVATTVVDAELSVPDELAEHDLIGVVSPDNAAYLMYTSGSTGEPMGVTVEHRNVVASLEARRIAYQQPVDRFLLLSSFAFDSSVAGIFWTLCDGGTLILPSQGVVLEPAELLQTVARLRPTHTLAIPSLLAPVLDLGSWAELRSLQVLIAAGESCPVELYRSSRDLLPDCLFANEYGPTETTVWSTVWHGTLPDDRLRVPIGQPVANTWVEVISPFGRPVPVGVMGELHIGGSGVSRGYRDRPAHTAARFRPDPSPERSGARVYATGDLGRYLPEGQLEFLGRSDHQVKIRGFRVEPGEIEAVLATHPALQRAIVVARGDTDNEKTLVAYVLPRPGQRPSSSELQQHVRDRLPRYMVPSACVVLESVPLTATGKLDRTSLPAPRSEELFDLGEYVAPSSDTEMILCEIWSSVLGLESVGVHDRFFDIGGESLRAMQATTAVNKMFDTRISVRRLFDAPTVAEFARAVDSARLVDESTQATPRHAEPVALRGGQR